MFKVPADNPPVPFSIDLSHVSGADSEGNPVPVSVGDLDVEITSSDEDVVDVTLDEGSDTSGSLAFGHPGLATVEIAVRYRGRLVGTGAASFTVVPGDLASISGISLGVGGGLQEEGGAPADVTFGGATGGAQPGGAFGSSDTAARDTGTAASDTGTETGGAAQGGESSGATGGEQAAEPSQPTPVRDTAEE